MIHHCSWKQTFGGKHVRGSAELQTTLYGLRCYRIQIKKWKWSATFKNVQDYSVIANQTKNLSHPCFLWPRWLRSFLCSRRRCPARSLSPGRRTLMGSGQMVRPVLTHARQAFSAVGHMQKISHNKKKTKTKKNTLKKPIRGLGHLICHVCQVPLHGISILPIRIVFGLYLTDPREQGSKLKVEAAWWSSH